MNESCVRLNNKKIDTIGKANDDQRCLRPNFPPAILVKLNELNKIYSIKKFLRIYLI